MGLVIPFLTPPLLSVGPGPMGPTAGTARRFPGGFRNPLYSQKGPGCRTLDGVRAYGAGQGRFPAAGTQIRAGPGY